MANPQKENGHTSIANEILEALLKAKLNGTEWEVLMVVIRKTYGFQKKEDWISYTQFQEMTGKARPNIWKAIEKLVTKTILVTKKKPGKTFYRFNKDYTRWVVTESKLVTKKKPTSYEKETQLVTKAQPTKETITKETIQKKKAPSVSGEYTKEFNLLWEVERRRENKKKAFASFRRVKVPVDVLISAYKKQWETKWKGKELRFVPHLATWLNNERWNDEIETQQEKGYMDYL